MGKYAKTAEWLKKGKPLIPSVSQTYSKSYRYFCEGGGPAFLDHGKGSRVWDIDGNEFIDFNCGLGAISIGYNDETVNNAIMEQLKKGISFSQPTILEIQLAEKLVELIPCAEMVRFVKNGSDATASAVRLARAFTQKDLILCCGYHGFQDWYIGSTINDLGVPKSVQRLIKTFEYNDIESLKKAFRENKGQVAAVIMEPMRENGPKEGFLEEVKQLTHENEALLIFDEVVSGFRMALGGAQEYFGVTPDLSSFGKGMGNGCSCSAVLGRKDIIKLIDEGAFISSTFGGETLALAGTLASISVLEKPGSFEHIRELGKKWMKDIQKLLDEKDMNEYARIVGDEHHCGVMFSPKGSLKTNDLFSVFQQGIIAEGILGLILNNFCLAHTLDDIDKYVAAASKALDDVKKVVEQDSTEGVLKCEKFRPIFKRD